MKKVLTMLFVLLFILALQISSIQTSEAAASLKAPKNLKATALNNTSIKLTWSSVRGAKSYDIYRYNTSTNLYEKIANTKSKSYTNKRLNGGTTYKYKIQAIKGNLKSPFSKIVSKATKPNAPTGLSASATNSSISLKWNKTTGASKYKIYIATKKSGSYKYKASTKGLSYTIKGLIKNKTYYFKVSALNSSGESPKSKYLAVKAANPPPPPPAPIIFSGTGDAALSNIVLTSRFYTARFTHDGSRNFIVKDYFVDDQELLINEIGNYSGIVLMKNAGMHTLNIEADGTWSVEILPITSTSTMSFSGKGDYVTPYFKMPSNKIWNFTHDGSENFIIWAYSWSDWDLVVNKIGPYSGSQYVDLKSGNNTFFVITADGNWTVQHQ